MKQQIFFVFILYAIYFNALLSQFPGPAGTVGSTAIYQDSSIIKGWADSVIIERGYKNISDKSLGYTEYGEVKDVTGRADNQVVSLGDGGYAVYNLKTPLSNGAGPDFAVFENALNDEFLELAYVEVSSDGINFIRFPAVSLTPTDIQTGTFGLTDTRKINNLAGKYRVGYGTPFDLDSLEDNNLLDKTSISHIKIVDVVGSVDVQYGSMDSKGNFVNDPFPTPFATGGFDLDALGLINFKTTGLKKQIGEFFIYPTIADDFVNIESEVKDMKLQIIDIYGRTNMEISANNFGYKIQVNVSSLKKGIYVIKLFNSHNDDQILSRFYKK